MPAVTRKASWHIKAAAAPVVVLLALTGCSSAMSGDHANAPTASTAPTPLGDITPARPSTAGLKDVEHALDINTVGTIRWRVVYIDQTAYYSPAEELYIVGTNSEAVIAQRLAAAGFTVTSGLYRRPSKKYAMQTVHTELVPPGFTVKVHESDSLLTKNFTVPSTGIIVDIESDAV